MSCKTQQSSRQKTTVVATDTTAITQVAAQDSASVIARIDSIIIEEYNTDEQKSITLSVSQNKQGLKCSSQKSITPSVSQNKQGLKCSSQKRNDTSQMGAGSIKKITKIYGANICGTWFSKNDSLNKNMVHQEKSNTQIKQKTPTQKSAGVGIGYIIIAIVVIILVGYLIGKNAVQ